MISTKSILSVWLQPFLFSWLATQLAPSVLLTAETLMLCVGACALTQLSVSLLETDRALMLKYVNTMLDIMLLYAWSTWHVLNQVLVTNID